MAEPNSQNSIVNSTQASGNVYTLPQVRDFIVSLYRKILDRLDTYQNPNSEPDGFINRGDLIDYTQQILESDARSRIRDNRTFQYCRNILRGSGSGEPDLEGAVDCYLELQDNEEDHQAVTHFLSHHAIKYRTQGSLPKKISIKDLEAALAPQITYESEKFIESAASDRKAKTLSSLGIAQDEYLQAFTLIQALGNDYKPSLPLAQSGGKTKGNGPAR